MQNVFNLTNLKAMLFMCGGFIVSQLGGLDTLLKALLFLSVLDYVTGILSALYNKKLNSETGYKGIIKKVFIYCIVALSYCVQGVTGDSVPIRDIVVMFYIVNESLSILENGGKVISYPDKLREILEQLKGA